MRGPGRALLGLSAPGAPRHACLLQWLAEGAEYGAADAGLPLWHGVMSTSMWCGARLSDVLSQCGDERAAYYVCFEGSDDLPGQHYRRPAPPYPGSAPHSFLLFRSSNECEAAC